MAHGEVLEREDGSAGEEGAKEGPEATMRIQSTPASGMMSESRLTG